jgi:hypothetical protein
MAPSSNVAQISLGLNQSQLASGLRAAASSLVSFAAGVGSRMSQLAFSPRMAKGQQWVTHAAGQVAGTLAMRGIDLLVDQGKNVMDFENKLVRFGIAAKQTPMQLQAIRNAARQTAVATGQDAGQVLDSARAYVDLAGAQNSSIEKMNLLARAGQASEAEGKDLAGMMYQLTRSMKVADDQMEDTMGGLINMAKEGAIEPKQMAAEFAGVLPLFARFGVLGREGTVQAAALFQVIRDGANTASEAGTMLQRVYAGIQSYAPRFEKEGVKIYQKERDKLGRKVYLPFSVIFKNIQGSEAMKDPARIKKMFGRTEGWRGMLLGDEASRLSASDADAKIGKMVSRLQELEDAGRVNGVIQKDLATYVDSAGGKMAVAFEKMKTSIAEAFTPERITAFVNAIEGLGEKVGPLAEMVGKMSDGLNALYNTGKAIRKFVSPSEGPLAPTSGEDVQRYRADHPGLTELQAMQAMQQDWDRMRKLKADVEAAMVNDRTTKESDKIAVRASMTAPSGSNELNAAMSYIYSAGITPAYQRQLAEQVRKEMLDEDIKGGRARSVAETAPAQPTVADLQRLIETSLAPAIARSMAGNQPQVVIDGNPVATSSMNATDRRRK